MTRTPATLIMNRALILIGCHVTDFIGPCEECGNDRPDRFAFATFVDHATSALAGCTACSHIFTASAQLFAADEWDSLPVSTRDDFARALDLWALHLWPLTPAAAARAKAERES